MIFYYTENLEEYGVKYNNVNFYTPNEKYNEFKKSKTKKFAYKTIIALTNRTRFDYSKFSVVITNSNQSKYTIAEEYYYNIVHG